MQQEAVVGGEALEVWIDQDLCTGDGICAQYVPEVFELDIDGLAYVKSEQRASSVTVSDSSTMSPTSSSAMSS